MATKNWVHGIFTATLIATGSAAIALAATDGSSANANNATEAMFQRLDADHDGFVNRKEAAQQKDFLQAFDQADANRDGRLSQEEFAQAYSIYDRKQVGAFVDDSVITAKIKAAFIKDPDVSVLDVSVETDKGIVLLSGFVRNPHQAERAVEIASAVSGVKSVRSNLAVKSY